MKNRRERGKRYLEDLRYFRDRIHPADPNPPRDLQDFLDRVSDALRNPAAGGERKPPVDRGSGPRDSYGAARASQLEDAINEHLGGRYVSVEYLGRGRYQISIIPEHFVPIDPEVFQRMLRELGETQPQLHTDQNTSLWINTPHNQPRQEMVQSLTRNLFGNSQLHQDGLRLLLNNPQFQALFQGGKTLSGALTMLPQGLQAAIVLSFTAQTESPELSKALMLAGEGLPAVFSGVDSSRLNQLVQSLSRAFNLAQPGGEQVLKSLTQLFGATGLSSLKEVETFLKALMSHEIQNHPEGASLTDKLRQWAEKMTLAHHPQILGLNEMAQGSSTLNPMLGSILRALMGVLMMNPQNQWPRVIPNEQMLSEIAALLAARMAREKDKDERKGKRRKTREDEEALTSYYPYFDSPEEDSEKESTDSK